MSRSYRKHPISKDKNRTALKQANRQIRRDNGYIPDGGHYRKRYPQYDICDWWLYVPYDDFIRYQREFETEFNKQPLPEQEHYRKWYRLYKGK